MQKFMFVYQERKRIRTYVHIHFF